MKTEFKLTRDLRVLLDEPTYLWLVARARRKAGIGGTAAIGPVAREILSKAARRGGAYSPGWQVPKEVFKRKLKE